MKNSSVNFLHVQHFEKGGIKAVVWTDCVQTILMLLSMIVIIVKGTIDVSGLQTVWARNYDGGRPNFPE